LLLLLRVGVGAGWVGGGVSGVVRASPWYEGRSATRQSPCSGIQSCVAGTSQVRCWQRLPTEDYPNPNPTPTPTPHGSHPPLVVSPPGVGAGARDAHRVDLFGVGGGRAKCVVMVEDMVRALVCIFHRST